MKYNCISSIFLKVDDMSDLSSNNIITPDHKWNAETNLKAVKYKYSKTMFLKEDDLSASVINSQHLSSQTACSHAKEPRLYMKALQTN